MARTIELLQSLDDIDPALGRPLELRHDQVVPMPDQPRRYFDLKELEELADSLQTDGQRQPITVCKFRAKPGTFVLIAGERRWRAFDIIRQRTGSEPIIKAYVDVVRDHQDHFEKAFIDNLHRADLTDVDEAAAYRQLYVAGNSIAAIAKKAGKSVSHVHNYMKLDELPDEVKTLTNPSRPRSERLTTSGAIEIAKSGASHGEMIALAQETIARQLGIDETRQLITLRTGKSSYGVGGRLRKPSDDYKRLNTFLGNTKRAADQFLTLELDALYRSREDDSHDRAQDIAVIDLIVLKLQRMKSLIEEK